MDIGSSCHRHVPVELRAPCVGAQPEGTCVCLQCVCECVYIHVSVCECVYVCVCVNACMDVLVCEHV